MQFYNEPSQQIPARECNVVVAGGGTGGVIAAIAASRTGARTILVEAKGYPGGTVVEGGTYGIPYRAMLVTGIDNLYATGMMITSDWEAHMSTRNTVACMDQGQAAGIAAALCAKQPTSSRILPYDLLRKTLLADGVVLDN